MLKFRHTSLAVGALALLLNTACYSFQRPTTVALPVGNVVRLRLTPEGTSELTGTLGPRVAVAEGALASVRPDGSLMVGVDWIELTTGQRQQWNGEGQINMRRDLVQSVEARTLDQKKSWMVGAAAVAAAVLVAVIAMKSAGAHTTGDGSRGPPANP